MSRITMSVPSMCTKINDTICVLLYSQKNVLRFPIIKRKREVTCMKHACVRLFISAG